MAAGALQKWLFALIADILVASPYTRAVAQHPSWINSSVIYCVYPEIFSGSGFQGVTAQLNRLKQLGVNVIWLMPVTPVGQPIGGHPCRPERNGSSPTQSQWRARGVLRRTSAKGLPSISKNRAGHGDRTRIPFARTPYQCGSVIRS
jgi:hypothetical protein